MKRIPENIFPLCTTNTLVRRLFIYTALLFLVITPLGAATIIYDQPSSGNLQGHSVSDNHSPSTPNEYENSTAYHKKVSFIGRLVYVGEPTTFTFINIGPTGSGGSANKFYWTKVNDTSEWREIFYVIRAKGKTQSGVTIDFGGINKAIVTTGSTYEITYGAGDEQVAEGKPGFDAAGNPGTNTSNSHPYKYRFKSVFIDLMIVNTANKTWGEILDLLPSIGYYEKCLLITTTSGAAIDFHLSAHYLYWGSKSFTYSFEVEKEYLSPIPYGDLEFKKSKEDSLKVGTVRYASDVHKATVTFASNPTGTNQTFSLVCSSGKSISYLLAFEPIISNEGGGIVQVTESTNTFTTKEMTVPSPVATGSYKANRLEGNLRIYLPLLGEANPPMPGVYSSNIYILVVKKD